MKRTLAGLFGLIATVGLIGAAGVVALIGMAALVVLPAAAANAKTHVDRTITDPRITESSGLVVSLLHPGVLWTHNDSGNPPLIYAIGRDGRTQAALRLGAEPDIDWEAISQFRGPAHSIAPGKALIAIGDIGDNDAVRTSGVRIAIVREPSVLRAGVTSVSPIRVLRLRYPGGPRDAETLLSDPRTGRLYIVSKTLFGSTLYSVPLSLWPGGGGGTSKLTTLTEVATMSASFITDGGFLPNGRIVLRGYDQVSIIERPAAVHDGRLSTLASAMLPAQDQGESIALVDGGKQALIGSEGHREPVLRVTLPTVSSDPDGAGPQATLPSTPTASGAPTPAPTASSVIAGASDHTTPGLHFSRVGAVGVWLAVLAGGLALIALTVGSVMLLTRNE